MITPKFSVSQDSSQIHITIHAVHVRAQCLEFDVADHQFTFFASPYYLRLTFPGAIIEDENSKAKLDASTGDIHVTLSKQKPGEHFADLDMLSRLLSTRRERDHRPPLIEDLTNSNDNIDEDDLDWELPQTLNDDSLVTSEKYGFNMQYSGMLAHVAETPNEINEIANPEHTTNDDRQIIRVENEDQKFDIDYYIDNYINDDDILPLIKHKTRHYAALRAIQKQGDTSLSDSVNALSLVNNTDVEFTEAEQNAVLRLPRKSYVIDHPQSIYLGLADILFAYSLDHRINASEPTVESSWAIGKVSPTLSTLVRFSSLKNTVVACFRRALAYPLYRNWELCEKTLRDVYVLLKLGRKTVLRTLLEIKLMFDHHDVYYIYSKLFLDDYCVWIQTHATDEGVRSLAHNLRKLEIEKEDIGWSLEEFEDLALESSEDEEDEEDEKGILQDKCVDESVNEKAPENVLIQVVGEENKADDPVSHQEPESVPLESANVLDVPAGNPSFLINNMAGTSKDSLLQDKDDKAQSKKKPLIQILD